MKPITITMPPAYVPIIRAMWDEEIRFNEALQRALHATDAEREMYALRARIVVELRNQLEE